MNCSRCGQEFEGNFCPRCGMAAAAGTPMPRLCQRCGTGYVGNFCPLCGTPAWAPLVPQAVLVPHEPWGWAKEVLAVVWMVALFAYLAMAVLNLAFLVAASVQIIPGILAQDPQGCVASTGQRVACSGNLFILTPFPLPTAGGLRVIFRGLPLLGVPLLTWFVVLLGAIFTSYFFLAWRDGERTVKDLRGAVADMRAPVNSPSGWTALVQVTAAVFFFDIVYLIIILPLLGIKPSAPSAEGDAPWYTLYALANAPVYEELLARVMYLGLFLGLINLFLLASGRHRRGPWWRYLLGGGFKVDAVTAGPLLYSAALFAMAHVLGGGWAPWKLVDTFVAGLALGYLFLRWGLPASILLHFTVDYFAAGTSSSPFAAQIGLSLLLLVMVVAGAAFFFVFARRALIHILRAFGWQFRARPAVAAVQVMTMPQAPPPRPTMPAAPPGDFRAASNGPGLAFRCPRCGYPEARYEAGHLVCTRCGSRL